jgi:hypothetical protein
MQREERSWLSDQAFLDWCRLAEDAIYVATDNGSTQVELVKALRAMGKREIVHDEIRIHEDENKGGVRNTTLRHAWCDLLACVGAVSFKGSGSSSYTNLIMTMRGWR